MNLNYLKYFFSKDPFIPQNIKDSKKQSLNIIIFSKDRACQINSLLRSLKDNFYYTPDTVSILYKYTNSGFEDGYNKVISENIITNINWLREIDFKSNVRDLVLKMSPESLIMFLVDDNIIFRKIDITPTVANFHHKHLFISLRASRSYPRDKDLPFFSETNGFLEWQWQVKRKKSNTWNYPFSVDGNIYQSVRMQQILNNLTFAAPNSFESAMHAYRKCRWIRQINKAISPIEPAIFNNPLNRVQTEGTTWHKDIDPEFINKKYLAGFKIDNSKLYACKPMDTHDDMGLHFVSRITPK